MLSCLLDKWAMHVVISLGISVRHVSMTVGKMVRHVNMSLERSKRNVSMSLGKRVRLVLDEGLGMSPCLLDVE